MATIKISQTNTLGSSLQDADFVAGITPDVASPTGFRNVKIPMNYVMDYIGATVYSYWRINRQFVLTFNGITHHNIQPSDGLVNLGDGTDNMCIVGLIGDLPYNDNGSQYIFNARTLIREKSDGTILQVGFGVQYSSANGTNYVGVASPATRIAGLGTEGIQYLNNSVAIPYEHNGAPVEWVKISPLVWRQVNGQTQVIGCTMNFY